MGPLSQNTLILPNTTTNASATLLLPPSLLSPSSILVPHHNAFNPLLFSSAQLLVNSVFALAALFKLLSAVVAFGPKSTHVSAKRQPSWQSVLAYTMSVFQAAAYVALATARIASGSTPLSPQQNFLLSHAHQALVSSCDASLVVLATSVCLLIAATTLPAASPRSALLAAFWFAASSQHLVILVQDYFTPFALLSLPCNPSNPQIELLLKLSLFANAFAIFLLEKFQPHQPSDFAASKISALDKFTFSWLNTLIADGYKKNSISLSDIQKLNIDVNCSRSSKKLATHWKRQQDQKKATSEHLCFALFLTFGWQFFLVILMQFVENVVCFLQPLLLKHLIHFFAEYDCTTNDPPLLYGFLISLSMFAVSLCTTNLNNQFFMKLYKTGLHIKGSLMSIVYAKAMRLSQKSRLTKSTGDIVNLVAVDVNRVQNLSQQIQLFFSIPIKVALSIISLYYLFGDAVIAGLLVVLIMVPLNTVLLRVLKRLNSQQMKYKDSRIRIISETLSAIKCIKLYNWEFSILKNINSVRNGKELKNLKKIGIVISANKFFWCLIPILILFSTFFVYRKPLTSDVVFPALALFNIFTTPVLQIPSLISSIIEASLAFDRLTSYLNCEEIQNDHILKKNYTDDSSNVTNHVSINNCTFLWDNELIDRKKTVASSSLAGSYDEEALLFNDLGAEKVALQNITLNVKENELACITGSIGSGKSSLLNSIIGELPVLLNSKSSSVSVKGSIAYCSQIPWILNTSLRENILFGLPYEPEFYLETIRACDLVSDIRTLPQGDETLVGEKGISLSGGQKARISLARAVYSRKSIYILDDVLSAVDAHVAKKIITKVLSNETGLLRQNIRILATNNLAVLPHANSIITLGNKTITNVVHQTPSLCLVTSDETETIHGEQVDSNLDSAEEIDFRKDEDMSASNSILTDTFGTPGGSEQSSLCFSNDSGSSSSSLDSEPVRCEAKELPFFEKPSKGGIRWGTYMQYASSCSLGGIVLFFLMIVTSSTFQLLSSYWLKNWSEKNDKTGEYDAQSELFSLFISVYLVLGLTSSLFVFLKTFILYQFCSINASIHLHNSMVEAILKSPMSFFDVTPVGRILNRFSNDINKVDESLPKTFIRFFTSIISTAFTLGILIYHLPIIVLPMMLLALIYYYYQKFYVVASRDLKRIGSSSRSPIFNHLQESLSGAETIRSYQSLSLFEDINASHINFNLKALYIFRSVNRWLSFRLQMIGAMVMFLASGLALYSLKTRNPLSNGLVGLIMGYALEITESLNAIVRSSVEIETNIVCAERVLEYSNLEPEAPFFSPSGTSIESQWPQKGVIQFNSYSTRYKKELAPVLRDLSFKINSKEKIGIVGRTGAGKSSLALAIFRLIEPLSGDIAIDGIDTKNIGLNDLRSNLSIIPQDCLAFEGTVRSNLDPLKAHSDDELLEAIRLSHLKDHLEILFNLTQNDSHRKCKSILDLKISEGGRNFSVGQRQLLCLARALLNPSKVLILDEATAAVDPHTDKIIQATIRKEFCDKTILIVAHRLNTVMDCDKIMVLDYGKMVEFDDPKKLLQNESSHFYQLCKQERV